MAMLKRMVVSGFKSIRAMDLELSPLNVLIGANGAGKSNLVSFFKLLNEMMGGRPRRDRIKIHPTGRRAVGNLAGRIQSGRSLGKERDRWRAALMARGRTRKNTANTATATAPARRGRGNNKPQVAFACKLALNQWLLSLFRVKRFEELAEHLQREDLEGLDENNVHRFHIELSKQFRLGEEIALALLKKYTERYYTFRKREWELPHLEYQDLSETDPNLMGVAESPEDDHYYRILYDRSQAESAAKLEELKTAILRGDLKDWNFRGLRAIWSKSHLYQPLLYLDGKIVEIRPAALNKGERRFIEDLTAFHDRDRDFFQGSEFKEIEQRLGDPNVRLESFIVSNTPSHTMKRLWSMPKTEMQSRHILFQEEDQDTYIRNMLEHVR